MQVTHQPRPFHVRKHCHIRGYWDGIAKFTGKGIVGKPDIRHIAGAAIRFGKGTGTDDPVSIGQVLRSICLGYVDTGDAQFVEGKQFACLGYAVLIQITPYAQIPPLCIQIIDHAVRIGIFLGQCRKTIYGRSPGIERRGITEELRAIVDGSIAVAIQNKHPVIGGDPAGVDLNPVSIMIKHNGIPRWRKRGPGCCCVLAHHPDRLNPVTIQIKCDWRGLYESPRSVVVTGHTCDSIIHLRICVNT
ncbi:MAG: hypothetical protein CVU51_07375 [Deltaproteobacteria bacterium HGW-Deltaproteobacteria-1]|nr:MAG: hypothetical protein CVU51_07375 [Deltaproteobacteria bacterium HGW-Deltaproteobacteria-1]